MYELEYAIFATLFQLVFMVWWFRYCIKKWSDD